jgi:hypothetical protein
MTNTAASILVTGRITLPSLDNALYENWEVTSFAANQHIECVAVVTALNDFANVDYMLGRLHSFGTIGARVEWTESDYSEAMERLNA